MPQARQSLRQRGLLIGVWPGRLANANQGLIRFINRFHRVAGFERVVADYFADKHKRTGAILIMRFAYRLAKRYPNFARLMSFERALSFAPSGHPIRVVNIVRNGVHYKFKPWAQINPFAIRRQFLHDMALFGNPNKVRWVFDGKRLGMQKRDILKQVRRVLARVQFPRGRPPDYRQWVAALDRIIVVA